MLGCGISCSTALGAARGGWEPWGRPVRKQLPTPTTARTATAVTAKELRAISKSRKVPGSTRTNSRSPSEAPVTHNQSRLAAQLVHSSTDPEKPKASSCSLQRVSKGSQGTEASQMPHHLKKRVNRRQYDEGISFLLI